MRSILTYLLVLKEGSLGELPSFTTLLFVVLLTTTSFIAWNYIGIVFLINLVVLFFILDLPLSYRKYLVLMSIFLMTWFAGALFWMVRLDKGVFAIGIYFFFYLAIFIFYYWMQRKVKLPVFSVIPFILCVELLLNTSSVSYPWLTIGNVLGNAYYFVQWYAVTGVLGGSFWLLITAFFLFKSILYIGHLSRAILSFILPILISLGIFYAKSMRLAQERPIEVISINPKYFQKKQQERYLYDIIKGLEGKKVDYLLLPELAMRGLDNKGFVKTKTYRTFNKAIANGSVDNIVLGTSGVKGKDSIVNSALVIYADTLYTKHKDRLVPYTEYMVPYLHRFFEKKFFIKDVPDYTDEIKQKGHSVLICYESFFPFYVAKESANTDLIILLSSEKFMNGSYYGKKQYDDIVRLRAIENNIHLVKSSWDGSSYILSNSGKRIQSGSEKHNHFIFSVSDKKTIRFFATFGKLSNLLLISTLILLSFYQRKL